MKVGSRRRGGAFSRGAAGLLSQVLSTVSNLSLTFFIARSVDAATFGSWSLAYVAYITGLHLSRSVVSTPVLLEGGGSIARRSIVRGASAAALGLGLLFGLVMVSGVLIFDGPPAVERAFMAFAVVMPALLLQDVLRHVFFRNTQARLAVWSDLIRLVVQLCVFVILEAAERPDLVSATIAWGLGAAVSSVVSLAALSALPGVRHGWQFVSRRRGQILRLAADSSLVTLATHALPIVVAATSGLAAAGYLRAGQSLLGGISVVVMGLTPIATVESKRHLERGRSRWTALGTWSITIGGLAAVYGTVLLLLPDTVAVEFVGDSWAGAAGLLVPLVLQSVLRGPATGIPIILRAEGRISDVLKLRSVTLVPTLGIPALAALWAGATGAAWGILGATILVGLMGALRFSPRHGA